MFPANRVHTFPFVLVYIVSWYGFPYYLRYYVIIVRLPIYTLSCYVSHHV